MSALRALSTTAYPLETKESATISGVRTSLRRSKKDEEEEEEGGGGGENEAALDEIDRAQVIAPLLALVLASSEESRRNINDSVVPEC